MKKITLAFTFLLIAFIGFQQLTFAQAQRLVLAEEFTQASCPPCASQNPGFNDLLNANTDKIRALKYQVSWPGVDPMNAQNPTQVATRVTYYGVQGVPYGVLDGTEISNDCNAYPGAPACLSQSDINMEYAVSSPFTMSLTHSLSAGKDSILITLIINAVGSVSGENRARIAVVEHEIDFNNPPGTNGETVFENVMKYMLPSAGGTVLPDVIDAGYSDTINVAWKLANIYNLNELAVVAFIQNDNGKEIYQSAYSVPLPPLADMAIATLSGYNAVTCDGSITPSATITNLGTNTITAATVSYSVGGGAAQTYDWVGSLDPGETTSSFTMPAVTVPDGGNNINVTVIINGIPFNGASALVDLASMTHGTAIGFGTASTAPVVEDFTANVFPPSEWAVNNVNTSSTWLRSGIVGAYQQQSHFGSVEYPYYSVSGADVDELFIENFDLSDAGQSQANLEFDYAKARHSGFNDQLKIFASSDCGQNWVSLFDKTDNTGLYTAVSTTNWKPSSSSDWRKVVIDMAQFIGQSNMLVKFQTRSGHGNNLYIDDINIHYGAPVGIVEVPSSSIMIYPNPANDNVVIQISGIISAQTTLEIVNVMGQVIYSEAARSNTDISISTSEMESGHYIYRLNDNGKILAQDKFSIVH